MITFYCFFVEMGLTAGKNSGNINKLSHERRSGDRFGRRQGMKEDSRNLPKKSLTLPLECGKILNGS